MRWKLLVTAAGGSRRGAGENRTRGAVGGVPVGLIDIDGTPGMITEGQTVLARDVELIDVSAGRLTFRTRRTGQTEVLEIVNPRDLAWPELDEAAVERLMERAISGETIHASTVPREVHMGWTQLSREAREEILLRLLSNGIAARYLEMPTGGVQGSQSFIFEGRLAERARKRFAEFFASLTPEQQKVFSRGTSAYNFSASLEEQRRSEARVKETREQQERVIQSLTPEQRKLYDAWQGRTTRTP